MARISLNQYHQVTSKQNLEEICPFTNYGAPRAEAQVSGVIVSP
ncbi:MAG TPA: hypothetical protein VH164_14990 [Ktedonobacteraceae bacterium]|nr:hypothetical protein [Ktedonobacteraceae bacterium]